MLPVFWIMPNTLLHPVFSNTLSQLLPPAASPHISVDLVHQKELTAITYPPEKICHFDVQTVTILGPTKI